LAWAVALSRYTRSATDPVLQKPALSEALTQPPELSVQIDDCLSGVPVVVTGQAKQGHTYQLPIKVCHEMRKPSRVLDPNVEQAEALRLGDDHVGASGPKVGASLCGTMNTDIA
jgi:hypothetical protein